MLRIILWYMNTIFLFREELCNKKMISYLYEFYTNSLKTHNFYFNVQNYKGILKINSLRFCTKKKF